MNFEAKRREAFESLARCYRTEVLSLAETSSKRRRAEVWQVIVEVAVGDDVQDVTLELRVPLDFPLSLPRPYLGRSDRERLGPLPHVDDAGFICTFDPVGLHINAEEPGKVAVACVSKAARLLEAGINGTNAADFEDELIAYWACSYGKDDVVEGGWLSLLDAPPTGPVYHLRLEQAFGPFRDVIHTGGAVHERFLHNLEILGIKHVESEVFYAPAPPAERPPFGMTNGYVVELMERLGLDQNFARYVNTCGRSAVVAFGKSIDGHHVTLGWKHEVPRLQRNGFRKGTLRPYDVMRTFERHRHVVRLNPSRFTPERLQARTTGEGVERHRRPAFFVAGLGSVGSHVAHPLGSGLASRLGLLDPEELRVENVGRHLLGLPSVGSNKAIAMRDYFLSRNPLLPVTAVEGLRLAEAVQIDPELLSDYDRLVVATGDPATEMWLGEELAAKRVEVPAFFLWVEPHLAGGHCVYVRPGEAALGDLFDGGIYRWNVVAPEEHRARSFAAREAGCQTSFVPYAAAHVLLFVAAVLPHIANAAVDDEAPSFRLTWTGDLDAVGDLGVTVTDAARTKGRFHLEKASI